MSLRLAVILAAPSPVSARQVLVRTAGRRAGTSSDLPLPAASRSSKSGCRQVDCAYIQLYTVAVRFGWDEQKSSRNFRDRGFDFEFATLIFEGPTLEREDARRDYGERRVVAIGIAQGIALTVVYTDRTEAGEVVRRIISARLSDRHERQAYFEATSRT